MRREKHFYRSVILLISLILSLHGMGTRGLAAPVTTPGYDAATAAESGQTRFDPAACPWKLPDGQVEGQTVTCGFAVVPEAHRNPGGSTIKLPVAVFKSVSATPAPDPVVGGADPVSLGRLRRGDPLPRVRLAAVRQLAPFLKDAGSKPTAQATIRLALADADEPTRTEAAKMGARVETVPSISPTSAGCTS